MKDFIALKANSYNRSCRSYRIYRQMSTRRAILAFIVIIANDINDIIIIIISMLSDWLELLPDFRHMEFPLSQYKNRRTGILIKPKN